MRTATAAAAIRLHQSHVAATAAVDGTVANATDDTTATVATRCNLLLTATY